MKDAGGRLVASLFGIIVTLVVLLGTMGATFATSEDVSRQIALEAPYVQDRSLILYRLREIEKKLDLLLVQRE